MNISVGDYTIKRELTGQTFIHKKGSSVAKFIKEPPHHSELNAISFKEALRKMQTAYETGKWPIDRSN